MKYAPNKIFILENGRYQELTYEEFCKRKEQEPEFSEKLLIPIHGVLMEVTEKTYREFYRDKRRQKYIKEQEVRRGDFSFDSLDTDEFHGEDILVDMQVNVSEEVERKELIQTVRLALFLLSGADRKFVEEIFVQERTERQLAKEYGVSQVAIHKRKKRILEKLKKSLEKFKN